MTQSFTGPSSPFDATVGVPGDKSVSHRAVILATFADGPCTMRGLGPGLDVASSVNAVEALGASIGRGTEAVTVTPGEPPSGDINVDCGNSGTTMRLLIGATSSGPATVVFTGDASLTRRPMERLVAPLTSLGASVGTTGGFPPVTVHGRTLRGGRVVLDLASAQVRTAVALAALRARGTTTIDSPIGFRDHTERWLEAMGRGRYLTSTAFEVLPGTVPAFEVTIPGDPSSAAFVWTSAAITSGARVTTPGVLLNPGRVGFLDILRTMGGDVDVAVTAEAFGDPIGTVTVSHAPLSGTTVSGHVSVTAIDELPLVAVLGAFARSGATVIADAAELRTKETDRIAATVALINALGGSARATDDGLIIEPQSLGSGRVDAGGDHRIAMAAAVAASPGGSVEVEGFDAASVSWPGFERVLEDLWSSQ